MRVGDSKLFRDKHLLSAMLALRTWGWSLTSLALLFDCDRSSIAEWCDKYGVVPQDVFTIERIALVAIRPLTETKWKEINGEKLNKGKTYQDYLKQYPHRKRGVISYN